MATISVSSNARQVAAFFVTRADGVRIYAAAASATLAKTVKDVVLPMLIEEAPEVTGDLKRSHGVRTVIVPGGADLHFYADSEHAKYVIEGTGIYHVPDAHSAWDVDKPQAFVVAGNKVFAMHTHHEGQHANPYPDRAMDRAMPAVIAAIAVLDNRLVAVFR